MKLIICKPLESGALNIKVQASKEERKALADLEGEEIEVHPAGRIITLDEQASEKFAAIISDLDAVLNRYRKQPDMLAAGGEHAGSLYE